MKSARDRAFDELSSAINGQVCRIEGPIFLFTVSNVGYSITGKFKERSIIIDLEAYGEILIRFDCNTKYPFEILPNTFFSRNSVAADKE